MDTTILTSLIATLQAFSAETTSIILFIVSAVTILVLFYQFQLFGLYLYACLATIIANIQVLKISPFASATEPVALGTVTFATIFLVTDIITEHYGKQAAKKSIGLCFATQVVMTVMMVLTIGFTPIAGDPAQHALETLFLPAPRLLVASITAFISSQLIEIYLFKWLKDYTAGKHLWLRTNVSTIIAALIDNVIFSVLAWQLLSPLPVTFSVLIFTYIIPTYIARVLVSIAATPVIYGSYRCLRRPA